MYRKMVVVYEGEKVLGEAELLPQDGGLVAEDVKEIRVLHYSLPSERCSPLAVLHTVKSAGICFKLESPAKNRDSPLSHLHATCLRENKTAVTFIGGREIHLVAMHSRKYEEQTPCFWGFSVASSLYNSCLVMLNLRCLGIVFDLDETLIVANTMRSFEDKLGALQRKINSESDPHRLSGLLAEFKRYQDDKDMLKQYLDTDQVIENGKIFKSRSEVVPALSEAHPSIVRPVVRLQDRNIILTRINPLIRDTSVLVRLRPAWEDLRTYLIAKGRKRFEVFVCTMAEKDYALEMWRLLDPEYHLINLRDLSDRVVSVKGTRKSLFNVFQVGNCHPKMALVIDDRLKVWEDKDQPRVHVVPAFAPYHAPQAEANSSVSVLCVVRNVACNVRGGFFKEFDDGLLQQISGVAYEDDIKDVPSSPDVSYYLIPEGDSSASNGNKDSLGSDGMADAEVERRLKEAISASSASPATLNLDPKVSAVLQYTRPSSSFTVPPPTIQGPAMSSASPQVPQVSTLLKSPLAQLGQAETIVHSSPAREEGEVPESELDPDTRRRLLILQHGQDMRGQNPPSKTQSPAQPSVQVSVPRIRPQRWFPSEEETGPRQLNQFAQSKDFPLPADSTPNDNIRVLHQPFLHRNGSSILPGRVVQESQRSLKEAIPREEQSRLNQPLSSLNSFIANKDPDLESGQIDPYMETFTQALEDIALQCGTKVEFKQTLVSSANLQFFVEVLFAGERIGEGFGRTRREALHQAAEGSLLNLADKYFLQCRPDSSYMPGGGSRHASPKRNGFVANANTFEYHSSPREGGIPLSTSIAQSKFLDPRIEVSKKQMDPVAALNELCVMEGLSVAFETQHQYSANPSQKNEVYAQVEINGQIMGKGLGLTLDEAKSQAAEVTIEAVKSMLGQFPYNRQRVCSPRSMQVPNKRVKQEMSRVPHRMPSLGRYPRNESPAP